MAASSNTGGELIRFENSRSNTPVRFRYLGEHANFHAATNAAALRLGKRGMDSLAPRNEQSGSPSRSTADQTAVGNRYHAGTVGEQPSMAEETAQIERWRRNEVRYLAGRVEELERRLRRRTLALGCALAVSMGMAAAVAIIGFLEPKFGVLSPLGSAAGTAAASNPPAMGTALATPDGHDQERPVDMLSAREP